jgi:hypothetical protein
MRVSLPLLIFFDILILLQDICFLSAPIKAAL